VIPFGPKTISLGKSSFLLLRCSTETPFLQRSRSSTSHNQVKKKGQKPGQLKLTIHYPAGKATAQQGTAKTDAPKDSPKEQKKTVHDLYTFGKVLGTGGFSVVKEGTNKKTGVNYAIKIIQKDANPDEIALLYSEIDIMQKLRHPNIISLHEVFEDEKTLYLVLELVSGGELFDQIIGKGTYPETEAALVVKQILEAVAYMHLNGIAHRDLKPENLLCSGPNNSVIKVTDFGLSKDFGRASMKTSCGTPDYVAPEVLKGAKYDNSVDLWSIGVITYILVCGFPPFYGQDEQAVFGKILKCEYSFPSPDWDSKSEAVKDFISSILVLDVNARPTAAECLESPWVAKGGKA